MKNLFAVTLLLSLVAGSAFAQANKEKLETFNCRWEPLPRTTSGNGILKGTESAIDCFLQVRLIFIQTEHSRLPQQQILKQIYRSKTTEVTYLDEKRRTIICQIRPVKPAYDFITEQDVQADADRNGGHVSQELMDLIDENIELDCPMS